MNGISLTLSRLPSARALIAGAALLAGAATSQARAHEQYASDGSDDIAMAIPRVSPQGSTGIALPQPLPPSDVQRIRRVFALQARVDIPAAIAETPQDASPLLLGHILADRYLRSAATGPDRSGVGELSGWLASYADLPDAPAIHSLLLTVLPKGAPVPPDAATAGAASAAIEDAGHVRRNPVLDRSVHEPARAGHADRAVRLIARTRGLDPVYGALLRAEVAQVLFTQGRDAEALSLAEAAHRQAHGQVGLAPFIAGLAAWRLDRVDVARPLFEAAYHAPLTSPGRHAAAAFWAARAHQRSRNSSGYVPWMQQAASNPGVFYGLLARRALGRKPGDASLPDDTLGEADVDAIADTPAGARAFALLQVDEPRRAEAELQRLWTDTRDKPGFSRSILLVARAAGLAEFAAQLATRLQPNSVELPLPLARLRPAGGFKTDPALIYAMARLESNFDPRAVSRAGARGLMQIMPVTAQSMVRDEAGHGGSKLGGKRGGNSPRLHDPAVNLDLGQRYLLHLAQYDSIGPDLIRLLASYNAGPGSFARWGGEIRHMGDPLLFIESIPLDETRAYIPRALTYTWLYAAQLRVPAPSLDELAAGIWPRFTPRVPRSEVIAQLH